LEGILENVIGDDNVKAKEIFEEVDGMKLLPEESEEAVKPWYPEEAVEPVEEMKPEQPVEAEEPMKTVKPIHMYFKLTKDLKIDIPKADDDLGQKE